MADDSAHGVAKPVEKPGKVAPLAVVDPDPIDFGMPVDSEGKSKVLRIFSLQRPHMLSFHLNWLSFFVSFISTFAAAPLITVIRENINLTKADAGNAGIAAVSGTIASRILMGTVVDGVGPRYGSSILLMLTSCPVFGMMLVENAAGFITARLLIGFSLATFVACQFWCSTMFSANVVGLANATAGGWGNLGGGVTQLLMPLLLEAFAKSQPEFIAWRLSYLIPAFAHVIVATLVLTLGQDLPYGNYSELKKKGAMNKPKSGREFVCAVTNYRMWCLVITYGYSFGVELTVDNVFAGYFADNFGLGVTAAGTYAALFGLGNIFARALGGHVSDLAAKPYGMRGRLWALWIIQTVGGVLCLVLGLLYQSLGATIAVVVIFSIFIPMACGATFGVVPFISRRSLGLVSGFIGAGGNAGSAITQAIFFTPANLTTYDGLFYMGIMSIVLTIPVMFIWFPMWGSMFTKGNPNITEEEYFIRDFTESERKLGLHQSVLKFAAESKSQRGFKVLQQEEAKSAVEMKQTSTNV